MTQIQAPTFDEILQVCDFAESRIETIEHDAKYGDCDPLSEWEASCLGKVWNWVKLLQKATPEDHVRLANDTLNSSGLDVASMVTVSTGHISEDTAKNLEANVADLGAYSKGEYGWLIYAGDDRKSTDPSLQACIAYAQSLGCVWLCLDRDGAVVESLPQYDW